MLGSLLSFVADLALVPANAHGSTSGGSLTTVDATIAGDVTLVNANAFVDGPSASFATGTWLIVWKVSLEVIVATAQSYWWTAKLWDGTTTYDEVETGLIGISANQSGSVYPANGHAVVVLGSTTTLKVSVAPGRGSSASSIKRDAVDNPANSHTATRLSGVKVA